MVKSQTTPPNGLLGRYRQLPPTVLALSVVSLLNDTSSEIIYPLLPAFLALTLGASPFAIGLIEGFAESVASILKLFSGYLSDKFNNRKLPVFLGYSLAAIMRPMLSFVTSWPQVLVVRMTDRVGKGIRGAPRDAMIAASVPPESRGLAFGFNRAADHAGAVIGPVIAFLLLTLMAVDPDNPTARERTQKFAEMQHHPQQRQQRRSDPGLFRPQQQERVGRVGKREQRYDRQKPYEISVELAE